MLQRQEVANYTEGQISDNLTFSLNMVEILDPPTDLREAVFEAASQMHRAKQVIMSEGPPILGVRNGGQ